MADIATVWDGQFGDWVQLGAALETGDDLTTAVLISLFTDARASASDVIPDAPQTGPGDPRGWWGDLGADRPIGSKLWLRSRAKQTAQTLSAVKNDIATALQWLIDDGVAASIDVAARWAAPGFLAAAVEIFRVDGSKVSVKFQSVWAGLI